MRLREMYVRSTICFSRPLVDHERVFEISVNKEREEKWHKGSIPVFKNIVYRVFQSSYI